MNFFIFSARIWAASLAFSSSMTCVPVGGGPPQPPETVIAPRPRPHSKPAAHRVRVILIALSPGRETSRCHTATMSCPSETAPDPNRPGSPPGRIGKTGVQTVFEDDRLTEDLEE